jgi:hypothetical protein
MADKGTRFRTPSTTTIDETYIQALFVFQPFLQFQHLNLQLCDCFACLFFFLSKNLGNTPKKKVTTTKHFCKNTTNHNQEKASLGQKEN